MRLKLHVLRLMIVALALALAACGSTTKSSGGSRGSSRLGRPSRAFHVKLSGRVEVPAGAPKGTGSAVIALHERSLKVCWRFAHLRGFTKPTAAHIHLGAKGSSGNVTVPLSTGSKFLHKGCVNTTATIIKAIARDPRRYYVNIHSARYPGGAVRAQL